MQFNIERFKQKEHGKFITKWMKERGLGDSPNFAYLPPTGFVVFYYAQPICIGFMTKCDNGTVINSDLIANPSVPQDLRQMAVECLRKTLYNEAKTAGFRVVTVTTSYQSHAERLQSLGYTVVEKNLTQLVKGL